MNKVEEARRPLILLRLARALVWAYFNGYRPVPGYTICQREGDGFLYLAVQMEKRP